MKIYIVTDYGETIKEVFSNKEIAEEYAELVRGYLIEKELLQNIFKIHHYWRFDVSGRQYGCSINIQESYSPLMKYSREEVSYSGNRTTAGSGWTHISKERAEELAEDMKKTYLTDMTDPKSERYAFINDTSPMTEMYTSMETPIPPHSFSEKTYYD